MCIAKLAAHKCVLFPCIPGSWRGERLLQRGNVGVYKNVLCNCSDNYPRKERSLLSLLGEKFRGGRNANLAAASAVIPLKQGCKGTQYVL